MDKRKGKGYWCYLVPKHRKLSRNRAGMELGTFYIPGSHGGDTQQRLLPCFSAVHHWEQPMWSLSSWLVSVPCEGTDLELCRSTPELQEA